LSEKPDMKRIEHAVFAESATPPFWACFAGARRERRLKKIRERAGDLINEVGAENIVSVTEHAPTFGPFSVVVWWNHELPDTDTPVIRAALENQNA
jgi:hypothetical protein